MEDKTLKQVLAEISQQLRPLSQLSLEIATKADLQEYTENMYNQLVQLAYEGIDFLMHVQLGETITPEWIAERDELVKRAQRLILDAPNAHQSDSSLS